MKYVIYQGTTYTGIWCETKATAIEVCAAMTLANACEYDYKEVK